MWLIENKNWGWDDLLVGKKRSKRKVLNCSTFLPRRNSLVICLLLWLYSKVPNKWGPFAYFFWKKNPTPPLLLGPLRLLIFVFSSLAPKKFERCKTYLSIRNSTKSNEIDFSNVFVLNVIFKWAWENKTKWLRFESSCWTLKWEKHSLEVKKSKRKIK